MRIDRAVPASGRSSGGRAQSGLILLAPKLALALASALVLMTACSKEPAEQRLRHTIDAMQLAIEEGQRGDFMERVAENFGGQYGTGGRSGGQFTRDELDRLLRIQMLRHTRIGTTITGLEIEMFEQRATATMRVLVTGGPAAWIPDNADYLEVSSGWVDSDDGWQLISASWQ